MVENGRRLLEGISGALQISGIYTVTGRFAFFFLFQESELLNLVCGLNPVAFRCILMLLFPLGLADNELYVTLS